MAASPHGRFSIATLPPCRSQAGGNIYVTGTARVIMTAGSRCVGGLALEGLGDNIYVDPASDGSLTYYLPMPAGRWLPSGKCLVLREGCPYIESVDEEKQQQCVNSIASCALDPDLPLNQPPLYCQPPKFVQECNWAANATGVDPSLVGQSLHLLPRRSVDVEFPYLCPAGVLGSSDPEDQASPECRGSCPGGFSCRHPATLDPSRARRGTTALKDRWSRRYAERASSPIARKLSPWMRANLVPSGAGARPASIAHETCSPGTYANEIGQSECARCEPGKYQAEPGATECVACPAGMYCRLGSATPLFCLEGSYSNATSLRMPEECATCPVGQWCGAGSLGPTPCSPGTFADIEGRKECWPCGPGTSQLEPGATSCNACLPGTYCTEGLSPPASARMGHTPM